MAWLDERVWCHPKFTDLSNGAFRVYWNSVAYSSGMETKGVLSAAQQKLVGCTPKIRRELVDGRLWDVLRGESVSVHDWDDHNEKRDAKKAADRERKRAERAKQRGQSDGQSDGQTPDESEDRRGLKGDRVKGEEETPQSPPFPDPVDNLRLLQQRIGVQ